ncbi:MAG TPA: hypothetical protein VH458_21725 [Vicinamibacterales bacterium]
MGPSLAPIVIVACTGLSYPVATLVGVPALVPVLNTLPALPFMIGSLRRGAVDEAVVRMLIWAAALAVTATATSYVAPAEMSHLFLHGETYRKEMFVFVMTGEGAEGNIHLFLPEHARHALVFCGLAFGSGSLLAMPLGAALMNYMAYYVGTLGAASQRPLAVMALAWVPWALIRIVSFVTLGVVLGGPVLGRLFRFEYRLGDQRRWIAWALAGLVADVVLKWALAPWWRGLIRAAVGW